MQNEIEALFEKEFGQSATYIASAPGRIEFIGNHIDYNGGTVLGAAINRFVMVAVAPRSDKELHLRSFTGGDSHLVSLNELKPHSGKESWLNYPLGVLVMLQRAGMQTPQGFDLAVHSNLPSGAGLSSSAAFELATAIALGALYGFKMEREQLVKLCQQAENEFVGVPCGVLDQASSAYGQADQLVCIECREPSFSTVPLPQGVHFWIFNTNEKHSLVDSLYATRHRECQLALRQVQTELPETEYLTDLSPSQLMAMAPSIREDHFARARHVIEEHYRVAECIEILTSTGDMQAIGSLLYASHASSSSQFGNSTPALDKLVELLKTESKVWGARLTGGGFGGAVLAVTKPEFSVEDAERITIAYTQARPEAPVPSIFHVTTADGARLIQ